MKRVVFFVVSLFSAMAAVAQSNHGSHNDADEKWRKSTGAFGVILLLTDEPEKLMNDWNKPEPPGIKTTSVATRGIPIATVLLFTGCAESLGTCNTKVDFAVVKPDGSIYGTQSGVLWNRKPPPTGHIQLSEAYLGIRIEPKDPAGTYQVQAVVKDLNANLELTLSRTFDVENETPNPAVHTDSAPAALRR